MPDDSDTLTIFRNDRDGNALKVVDMHGRFDLTTTGGGNLSDDEFMQISAFVSGRDGDAAFLGKLQARMER